MDFHYEFIFNRGRNPFKDYVNMGLAVAVESGLIVPAIKNAPMTLEEI